MITLPEIDPVIFKIYGPLQVRWYGLMYVIGFFGCWWCFLARHRNDSFWDRTTVTDLVFYIAIGALVGGRLGYTLFYGLGPLLNDPLGLFRVWEGGMSFHGGLIGVFIALCLYSRHYNRPLLEIGDKVAPTVPICIAFVRMGNFINGELWGTISQVPWAMVFPAGGPFARHPSQLYAVLLEGCLLFVLLWGFSKKARGLGQVSGAFLFFYGSIRIFEEFFRQPDPQFGYLAFGWLTMGQILSVPMILFGLYLWFGPKRPVFQEKGV